MTTRASILLVLEIFCLSWPGFTQSDTSANGIHFEHGLTWTQVKSKAKEEHKYIFIDCYTTWCGPCHYMNQFIFPVKEVGDLYNEDFISIQVQMDQTQKDLPDIKSWYNDANTLEKTYSIVNYPTYLFFSSDGTPLHKMIGSFKDWESFLVATRDVFDPNKQYFSLINDFKKHDGDSLYLRNSILKAINVSDISLAEEIGNSYINCLKNPYDKDNLTIISQITTTVKSKGFQIFYSNPSLVDKQIQLDFAEGIIRNTILSEYVYPKFTGKLSSFEWNKIAIYLKAHYPDYANRILSESKMNYYATRKDWAKYGRSVVFLLNNYGKTLDDFTLNNICWGIFKHCLDHNILKQTIPWSKCTVSKYPDCDGANLDTYANLLYKVGNVAQAIIWEKKAIEMPVSPGHKKDFEDALASMRRRKPTWPE